MRAGDKSRGKNTTSVLRRQNRGFTHYKETGNVSAQRSLCEREEKVKTIRGEQAAKCKIAKLTG